MGKDFVPNIDKCVDKARGVFAASVRSASLNRVLHKDGIANILLTSKSVKGRSSLISSDRLIMDSVAEYIDRQDELCLVIEKALFASYEKRMKEEFVDEVPIIKSSCDIWDYIKINSVCFRERRVIKSSVDEINMFIKKHPEFSMDDFKGDPVNLRTAYCVKFKVAWEEEHLLSVNFVDGVCQGIGFE